MRLVQDRVEFESLVPARHLIGEHRYLLGAIIGPKQYLAFNLGLLADDFQRVEFLIPERQIGGPIAAPKALYLGRFKRIFARQRELTGLIGPHPQQRRRRGRDGKSGLLAKRRERRNHQPFSRQSILLRKSL
jgi:hypothetical protein